MANGSKGENPETEVVEGEEVKKNENKVINGAKTPSVKSEGKDVKIEGRTSNAARTYVISAEEMEEFKMMKAVLATRLGKALFLDYLEGDIGRYMSI